MNEEHIPCRDASKLLGLTTQTIRLYGKKNLIKTYRTPTGQTLYNKQDIQDKLHGTSNSTEKQKIIYARVSSKKQEDDLGRQIQRLQDTYKDYNLIKDIGSGINWKRKGIQTILELAMSGSIEELVIAHKDRLCRFGFEIFQFLIEKGGGKIIILDKSEGDSKELAEDLLSIIHIYSCRQMGKRRYTKKSDSKVISEQTAKENND